MTAAARAQAEQEQLAGSDPGVSAFVSASAGSGKTKLLTDRLLRLMLSGAAPERIQCLTFTRAGAAEMSGRLQRRLGAWVTAADAMLDDELQKLALPLGEQLRTQARQLFGRVLDLPGGMRIGTIHAFCQSLLRRFPLEASLSPQFELLDETEQRALQQSAREAALATQDAADMAGAIEAVAPQLAMEQFAGLLAKLQSRRERLDDALVDGLPALLASQRRVLGLGADEEPDAILREAIGAIDLPGFREAMRKVAGDINGNLTTKVPKALAWLATAPPSRLADWHDWARYFLREDGNPCNHKWLVSAATAKAHPGLRELLLKEQACVCKVLERLRPAQVAQLSAALLRLAAPALEGYDARKRGTGRLDYADLITRTRALLQKPGAAWVLYKLDGGLDHLLLDEVQDTAPDQWRIADALTEEFFAGAGARELAMPRTIFAVGDHKQSIFSFQGASPDGFDHWSDRMKQRVLAAGAAWRAPRLDVSFRSTTPVLKLVDEVFKDARARLGISDQDSLAHLADRADQAGCIELWPLLPRPIKQEAPPWQTPDAAVAEKTGAALLAEAVAEWVATQLQRGVKLESRDRKLTAGDILVLVRKRGPFDQALLRELKARGVAVAGLDRMMLTDQPAVADLIALCDTLLLPNDDLSVATVLTSPLGGLDDDSLMRLALGRDSSLWTTLHRRGGERDDWEAARTMLDTLFARVDYVTPHALLSEALGALGGRARLYARLGPQAGEAIDELLSAALAYAARHPPSLQGFLHHVRAAGAEVVRQSEGETRELRIMTVHGAKGLEAPLVILPASFGLSPDRAKLVWMNDPESGRPVPLWGPRRETQDAVMQAGLDRALDAEREEHYRLLYVALTRAADRLLICGWEAGKQQQDRWYDVIGDAFARLPDLERAPFDGLARPWSGEVLRYATGQIGAPKPDKEKATAVPVALPAWAGKTAGWKPSPPPSEPELPVARAPSRPQDARLGPVPQAASPLALRDASGRRFRRGQIMHSLLQHLPNLPAAEREAAARAFLSRPGAQLAPGEAVAMTAELLTLLEDPILAPLFGPGSRAEVPLTGVIDTAGGKVVVGGLVDRLVELADQILVADFKTNREPPEDAAGIPALYRGQMESYRAVLQAIFPGRAVRCALIWTRGARVDWL